MKLFSSASRQFTRNIFALIMLLSFSLKVKAAIETDVNRLTGSQMSTSAVVTAVDNKYSYMVANNSGYPTPAYQSVFSLNGGVGRITVGVDPNLQTFVSTGYTANVTVAIAYYTDASLTTPLTVSNQTLTVVYDPYTNPANQSLQLDDRSLYELNTTNVSGAAKVVRVQATIVSITDASFATLAAPANLYLEVSTEVERFYKLDITNTPSASILQSTSPSTGNGNELMLNWSYMQGAESYDVEWTYVNDYTSAGVAMTSTVANANLVLDFAHNTTRVNVKGNTFGIPVIFDEGYIAFRIRAVGYAYNSATSTWLPVYGRWTGDNATLYASTPNTYLLGDFKTATTNSSFNHTFYVSNSLAYRLKMDWQYNAAFAEDGKKREKVCFYDGSLRNRQTVTKTSTDKKVLVGETILDYEGRGAINVLASPVAGNNLPLDYQYAFNRNSSAKAYSKADFDKDVSACATTTAAMNTSYGSAKYYSSSNPEVTNAQAFLPDASGYPFAQTEVNPDNTSRARRQGNVGPNMQIGSGHDMQYFYGHPAQEELDRLFGSDVGYAQHYSKTVTIDANGQPSVNYIDQEGRIIATGIGGDTLTKPLLALREGGAGSTSYSVNNLSMTEDLLAKDNDADVNDDQDNNLLSANGDMLEVSNQQVVSTRSTYSFAYTLAGDKFTYECLPSNVCYTCVYDLQIDIVDQCGNRPTLSSGTLPVTQTLGTISYDCTNSTASFSNTTTPLVATLDPGVYTVYKRLKINQPALTNYQANYLTQSTCVTTQSSMLSSALLAVDTTSCYASCPDCNDYQSPCEASYQMMLSDVSPNGQYGEYRDNSGNVNTGAFPVSVYNTSNLLRLANANWKNPLHEINGNYDYYEADGTTLSYIALSGTSPNYFPAVDNISNVVILSDGLPYIKPKNLLNVEDFVTYWRDSWAVSLVKYHPEYCYYTWCKGDIAVQSGSSISSDEFDRLMLTTTTKSAAVTAGLLDPLANATGTGSQSSATDPYFRSGGLGSAEYSTVEAQMRNYSGTNSIWKLAKIMTTCGTLYNATQSQIDACTGTSGGNETNFITGDAEWMNFRMLYLSLKQHYQQDKADASAMSCDGYNGCIGTTTFNPFSSGMVTTPIASSEFLDNSVTTGDYSRQPCSDLTYTYYEGKQKRFPNEDDVINSLTGNTANDLAALQTSINNNSLMTTGQCPIALDFQTFISKLGSTNQLKASALDLHTVNEFTTDLYNAMVPSSTYTTVNYTGTGTGSTLTLAFSGTSVTCTTSPTLSFGSSSSFVWSNYNVTGGFRIVGFSSLIPDASGGFTVIASIDDDMNTATAPITEYMTGTYGCISLTCTLSSTVCTANTLANDLFNMLNVVTVGGDLNNSSGADLTTGSYSTFFSSTLLDNYFTCGGDKYWEYVASTDYRIQCGSATSSGPYLYASFSSALPSGVTSFSYPTLTSSTQLQVTVNYGTSSTTTRTVTLTYFDGTKNTALNLGSCGAPVPEQCEGAEYTRRADLEALLVSKIGSAFTTTDASLQLSPAFPASLQQFGMGTYSWTPITSPSNSQWINISSGSQTCSLQLSFANTPVSGHTFSNITAFGQLVADETNLTNGLAYNFTITAWYSDGLSELINGVSCYVIRNCPVCTSAATSLYQNFDLVNTTTPGYTSGLTLYTSTACTSTTGKYLLTNNIATSCGSSYVGTDHTNVPNGKYFYGIFPSSATTSVWSKAVTVAPYAPYTFQCWYMDPTVGTYTSGATATVQLWANGVQLNSASVDDTRPGEWKLITGTWSGAQTAISCTVEVKVVTNATSTWNIAFDDFAFYTPGCGAQYNPPVSPTWPYNSPCASNLTNVATLNAQQQYAAYAATVNAQFAVDYTHHCINSAVETFKATFAENEYQYTLYYYDQGGNLVRTVPPQGVTTINLSADDNSNGISNGQEIKNQRTARLSNPSAAKTYYTAHRMMTNYKYNSLGQLVKQTTPDGGTTYFWYDKLGRIIASQNAKQAGQSPQAWSYTIYDAIGRVSEVGELYTNTDLKTMSSVTLNTTLNASNYPDNWAGTASSNNRVDVTRTYYDAAQSSFGVASHFSAGLQENLRRRVASAAVYDTYNGTNNAYTSATHYSYDIHGNVKEIIQETADLGVLDDATAGVYQRYKQIRYTYDLVSGNVKEVWYQDGQADRYYHKYHYDADNRVTAVYTSNDKRHWDRDAKYFYYQHGPLARTEYGQNKVQGTDDMYTLQGWIKGVNSNALGATYDAGKDAGTTTNAWVGSDEMGYSLNYYNGDYASIDATTSAIASITGSGLDAASYNLYNGNIRHMVTSIKYFDNSGYPGAMQAMAYKYDQLNRIRSSEQYTNYDSDANAWTSGGSGNAAYKEIFTYDHNGNIVRQKRNGSAANTSMDDLHYYYYTTATSPTTYDPASGTPSDATNKLAYVTDGVTSTYTDDIDNQSANNYTYDKIGQLTGDVQEGIATIAWSVCGKIKSITRISGSTKADLEFHYDAQGNRFVKIVKPRPGGSPSNQDAWTYTYYVRDAQGNVLATYERTMVKTGAAYTDKMKLKEQDIYGSSRVGIKNNDLVLTSKLYNFTSYSGVYLVGTLSSTTTPILSATVMKHTMNMKVYELSNHLGNVLVTVSDARQILHSGSNVSGFAAIVKSATDYSAFGAPMEGRTYTSSSYRYGFNGKENDPETSSTGVGTQDYGMRIYNPSLGRFLSTDPIAKKFAMLTPYQFASNKPIFAIDLDGAEADKPLNTTTTSVVLREENYQGTAVTAVHIITETVGYSYGVGFAPGDDEENGTDAYTPSPNEEVTTFTSDAVVYFDGNGVAIGGSYTQTTSDLSAEDSKTGQRTESNVQTTSYDELKSWSTDGMTFAGAGSSDPDVQVTVSPVVGNILVNVSHFNQVNGVDAPYQIQTEAQTNVVGPEASLALTALTIIAPETIIADVATAVGAAGSLQSAISSNAYGNIANDGLTLVQTNTYTATSNNCNNPDPDIPSGSVTTNTLKISGKTISSNTTTCENLMNKPK